MFAVSGNTIVLGSTPIIVSDDEFAEEFQTGYLRFHTDFKGRPLTDRAIYDFLAKNIYDVLHLPHANAGYISGWMAALFEIQSQSERPRITVSL